MRQRWWRVVSAGVVIGAALGSSAGVAAQDAASSVVVAEDAVRDLVVLANGARYRGVVAEYEPGVRVVVRLADGTLRTFEGAEIASVTFADSAPSAAPTAAPESTAVTEAASATPTPAPEAASATPTLAPESPSPVAPESPAAPESPVVPGSSRRVRFGVQLGAFGLLYGVESQATQASGGADLFHFVDVRLGRFGSFRGGALVSLAGPVYVYPSHEGHRTRSVGVGARLLLGHDLSDTVTLRVGGEAEMVIVDGAFLPLEALFRAELVGKLEGGHLELGGAVSVGASLGRDYYGYSDFLGVLPRVEFFVGGVF